MLANFTRQNVADHSTRQHEGRMQDSLVAKLAGRFYLLESSLTEFFPWSTITKAQELAPASILAALSQRTWDRTRVARCTAFNSDSVLGHEGNPQPCTPTTLFNTESWHEPTRSVAAPMGRKKHVLLAGIPKDI